MDVNSSRIFPGVTKAGKNPEQVGRKGTGCSPSSLLQTIQRSASVHVTYGVKRYRQLGTARFACCHWRCLQQLTVQQKCEWEHGISV